MVSGGNIVTLGAECDVRSRIWQNCNVLAIGMLRLVRDSGYSGCLQSLKVVMVTLVER